MRLLSIETLSGHGAAAARRSTDNLKQERHVKIYSLVFIINRKDQVIKLKASGYSFHVLNSL